MTKLILPFAATAAMAGGLAALSAPAVAQGTDRISEIIVYGNDPCPRSTDDEVVVCARKPESERYRIPERFRTGGPRQTREAWANKARALETVGATGINSCSPVGPAGFTGCLVQVIKQARGEDNEAARQETAPPE
ncbi:hypothetical protein [Sphingomonas sp.]|uniref:hypothetical protein n=1 Tax=Sphingomonas sp. TaxID=28214 RepID=UPI00182C5BBA|nr:hypothetical protein [Sphingomonas sp.]MBA3511734.1 hypothetical protein [Sphingomonas sp.]